MGCAGCRHDLLSHRRGFQLPGTPPFATHTEGNTIMASRKPETSGSKAATAASQVMRDPFASTAAKSAAASTLTQVRAKNEETRAAAASAAGKVLQDPHSTAREKSAAASALTQVDPKKR